MLMRGRVKGSFVKQYWLWHDVASCTLSLRTASTFSEMKATAIRLVALPTTDMGKRSESGLCLAT